MFFGSIFFLFLSLPATKSGPHTNDISKELVKRRGTEKHRYLRRGLQAAVTCQAINPMTLSSNDCTATYPCMCGSTETSCRYCEIESTRGHFCQATGNTMTFVDPVTSTMKTCLCEYGSGQALQTCYDSIDRAETDLVSRTGDFQNYKLIVILLSCEKVPRW